MSNIRKSLIDFWRKNFAKHMKKISEKIGAFITTTMTLFVPVFHNIVSVSLPPLLADFFVGVYIAFVTMMTYSIMKVMKNGNGNSEEKKD